MAAVYWVPLVLLGGGVLMGVAMLSGRRNMFGNGDDRLGIVGMADVVLFYWQTAPVVINAVTGHILTGSSGTVAFVIAIMQIGSLRLDAIGAEGNGQWQCLSRGMTATQKECLPFAVIVAACLWLALWTWRDRKLAKVSPVLAGAGTESLLSESDSKSDDAERKSVV